MTWNPDLLLEDFRRVAGMAGVSLAPDAIAIERRSAPHVPPSHCRSVSWPSTSSHSGSMCWRSGRSAPTALLATRTRLDTCTMFECFLIVGLRMGWARRGPQMGRERRGRAGAVGVCTDGCRLTCSQGGSGPILWEK